MIHLSVLGLASIIMDGAAVFLLAGLLIHTTIYRRRKGVSDILFFVMALLTIAMAVSDAITYLLDNSSVPKSYAISYFFNEIFYLTFETVSGLAALYFLVRARRPKPVLKGMGLLLMLPALAMDAMVIANHFNRFLFDVDPATNMYVDFDLYFLIFVGPAIYGVLSLFLILKIDWTVLWLYVVLIALRLFLGSILRGVSSTALLFAMGLVFAHVHIMGQPFREEAEQ